MMDVYVVTFKTHRGLLKQMAFMGISRSEVLYAAMEIYPDWDIVRVTRDVDWEADHHGAAPASCR